MDDYLNYVDLRIERSNLIIKSLVDDISQGVAGFIVPAHSEYLDDNHGFRIILDDVSKSLPLEKWSLDIGEALYHLRTALDNLSFALARIKCDPPKNPRTICFPIYSDKVSYYKAGRKYIEQLPDKAIDIIESVQPYQRLFLPVSSNPNEDELYLLNELNNIDKHRIPICVSIVPNNAFHFINDELSSHSSPPKISIHNGALEKNCILLEVRTSQPISSKEGSFAYQSKIMICFDGEYYEVSVLLPTLLHKAFSTISLFRHFFI